MKKTTYTVGWADERDSWDTWDFPTKTKAMSEATKMRRFIAVPIVVRDEKGTVIATIEPLEHNRRQCAETHERRTP